MGAMWTMSDKNDLDDAAAPESSDVFEFGDSTILQMRNQPFRVGDQYGTVMSEPLPDLESIRPEAGTDDPATWEGDPIARLEMKLDRALNQIEALQQRLDSIDSALARILNR